ncbi:hypothetical protein AEA09_07075 [Lysinibacillus contaminans]|uniref:RNA polymerase sigma factor 70 region 4 type 2 domain-containing protein n=1 Tax=Lysinibacillus contaminans TaxID=1293441 RepID=A0ABR5K0S7_9BACI|nr:hypothetical protein [Lysinibacillus contaminans]KOS68341.1 hypothetical protein AEA09_07075 [Lysinibacillus contaminans]
MEIMKNYADLVSLIDIVKAEIEMLEKDNKFWFGQSVHLPLRSEGSHRYGLDVSAERSDRLNNRIYQLQEKLAYYVVIEEEIRVNIEKLEGLPYKIAKLRFIDGHSYKEVADILGYSYSHIRKVVCKSI